MVMEYKKHFVIFMDILGYKNMVESVDSNPALAIDIMTKIEKMIKNAIKLEIKDAKKTFFFEIDYVLFSDSLCIFAPIDETEKGDIKKKYMNHSEEYIFNNYMRLYLLCNLISHIQIEALQYGIIFRGAVSIGNHFRNRNMIFSKGLVNAYLAESKEAKFPRIIILHETGNDILELAPVLYEEFEIGVCEDDDYLFVDYLGWVINYRGLIGEDCDYIKWHKDIIDKGFEKYATGSMNVLLKYGWMKNYHNNRLIPYFGEQAAVEGKKYAEAEKRISEYWSNYYYNNGIN